MKRSIGADRIGGSHMRSLHCDGTKRAFAQNASTGSMARLHPLWQFLIDFRRPETKHFLSASVIHTAIWKYPPQRGPR